MIIRLILLLVIGVVFSTVDGFGQNTWLKTYGDDVGKSIISTSDEGFVLTGSTYSEGRSQIFVMKINSVGDTVWKKTFGGSENEIGYSITTTNDGGYVLTGYTFSNNVDFNGMNKGYDDIFVLKLNSSGDIVWKKTIGGSLYEEGWSITTTNDGGYVLTGYTQSNDGDFIGMKKGERDIFVIKLNSNGETVWKKTFGGSGGGIGYSITRTTEGGFVLTGNTSSDDGDFSGMNKGSGDIFVILLNSSGDIVWKKTFGGSWYDQGHSIRTTTDGGNVLTGYTYSNEYDFNGMNKGKHDIFVLKLNLSGDIVWKKTFGGSNDDFSCSITTTNDGGYVLTGYTDSNDGDFSGMNKGSNDIFVIKLNSEGDIVWKKTFGGNETEGGFSITTTTDGGFVLTGGTRSSNGDFNGMRKKKDIFVMKLDSNGNLNNTTSINEFCEPTTTLSVYPNPFSNSTTVSYKVNTPSNVRIELLNTLGQIIEVLREDYIDIGTYQLLLNVSTLSSGMYSVRMISGSMNEVVPVCVVR